MSELTNSSGGTARWNLLATASTAALLGFICGPVGAQVTKSPDKPTVWIELGGQLSRLDEGQEAFAPTLMAGRPSGFSPSQKFERLPLESLGETGKISFEPAGSNWVFSASLQYGRSSSNRNLHQETDPPNITLNEGTSDLVFTPAGGKFADTRVQTGESHSIVDFQAGKDAGLGMFGSRDISSVVNIGVRFAQFSSKSNITLKSNPDWHFAYKYIFGLDIPQSVYHSNAATLNSTRSFRGIGPSIAWNASAPIVGTVSDGELSADWGLNAALLFGRQRTNIHHQTTGRYHSQGQYTGSRSTVYRPAPVDRSRAKSVTVPNIGGFASASLRIQNVKASLGYRADFFFGAMDGGIDTVRKENVGFYGPFASISVGLGG